LRDPLSGGKERKPLLQCGGGVKWEERERCESREREKEKLAGTPLAHH